VTVGSNRAARGTPSIYGATLGSNGGERHYHWRKGDKPGANFSHGMCKTGPRTIKGVWKKTCAFKKTSRDAGGLRGVGP